MVGLRRHCLTTILATMLLSAPGCMNLAEYVRNGFKVGPNYAPPPADTADHWIDEADVRVRTDADVPTHWWTVFGDETLNGLVECAASQNLSLREACFRVLAARAQLAIAKGGLFPQQQRMTGAYARVASPGTIFDTPPFDIPQPPPDPPIHVPSLRLDFLQRFTENWSLGFNLGWEIDFWGRLRRAIASAESSLDASIDSYNDVLVTLLGDVASTYVQIRTIQERIRLVEANVDLQRGILSIARRRFEAGSRNELDVAQASGNLHQAESQIPQLQANLRDACNRMCVLLGVAPMDLEARLGIGPIPTAPPEVILGIPADLLRRRPDVRRAERLAAAQAERIGIAEAALYPAIAINGTLGWQAEQFSELFSDRRFGGSLGPAFQWDILHYGRIRNNVRFQEARFQELVANYQNTVLRAGAEVESAIARFLRAHEVAQLMDRSVAAAQRAAEIVGRQYKEGDVDFNRVALIQQTLVEQQDRQALAHGEIAQGLILVYRAAGGGWEVPIPERSLDEIPQPEPVAWSRRGVTPNAPMPQ